MMQPPIVSEVAPYPGGAFYVCAAEGRPPSLQDLRQPGQVSALLTFDPERCWPDRQGESLLRAVLAQGGTAVLVFDRKRDAKRGRARLARWAR